MPFAIPDVVPKSSDGKIEGQARPGRRNPGQPKSSPIRIPRIETERLHLRPIEASDAVAIQAVFPQWEIVRYLSSKVPWPYPKDGAQRHLDEMVLPGMAAGSFFAWSLRPRTRPDDLIGEVNLRIGPQDNRGFWIDPRWRGRGLMMEASVAVTDFWFNELEQPVLRLQKATENIASRRISERQSMRIISSGSMGCVSGACPKEDWEITRDEWRAARPAITPWKSDT